MTRFKEQGVPGHHCRCRRCSAFTRGHCRSYHAAGVGCADHVEPSGLDSLYSIVQMPGGIPVAAFGIGKAGGVNAALFAIEILALENPDLKEKLVTYREKQKKLSWKRAPG